jgi:hypothetical protein
MGELLAARMRGIGTEYLDTRNHEESQSLERVTQTVIANADLRGIHITNQVTIRRDGVYYTFVEMTLDRSIMNRTMTNALLQEMRTTTDVRVERLLDQMQSAVLDMDR